MTEGCYEVVCDSFDRESWLNARRTGIGASEIAAVMGADPWTSALELYARKTEDVADVDDDDFESKPWLWVGRRIEDFIAGLYEELTGREIRKAGRLLRSKKHPWALATLDYETLIDGAWCPLEIKNVSAMKSSEWSEGPPKKYALQGQQQAMVTNAPLTSFCALIGGNQPVWADVSADADMEREIVCAGLSFWDRIQNRRPPLPDGSDSAARAIARMYPATQKFSVAMGSEFSDLTDELTHLKAEKRTLNGRIKEIEQRLKSKLGPAGAGILPDGRVWSLKTVERESFVSPASSYRKLHLHKAKKGSK